MKQDSGLDEKDSDKQGVFVRQYDVTSKERYVDSSSHKSEFDMVLDELRRISEETLAWDILKMTRRHFGGTEEDNARKYEAFMGAFITNAAALLYDSGQKEAAFKKLEQARTVLEAKEKLTREVEAIRAQTEEDAFDVSDMLDLFADE